MNATLIEMASRKWRQKLGGTQWICDRSVEATGGGDLRSFSVGEEVKTETEAEGGSVRTLEWASQKPADEMASR